MCLPYAFWISVNALTSFLTRCSFPNSSSMASIRPGSPLTSPVTLSLSASPLLPVRVASKPLPNTMGVFQGSSSGPLLFTIFANDLSLHAPDTHVTQYADDTQVFISDVKRNLPSLILRMESTLTSLASWFHAHGLKLNTSKTEILLLGTRQNTRDLSPVSVWVGGETIRENRCVKNLGVLFDRHLTWDAHVSDVVRSCVGLLVGLRHLRNFLPRLVMLAVVRALVISRVNYCLSVYGNRFNYQRGQADESHKFCDPCRHRSQKV